MNENITINTCRERILDMAEKYLNDSGAEGISPRLRNIKLDTRNGLLLATFIMDEVANEKPKGGYYVSLDDILERCPDLNELEPKEKPTVKCLWTKAWKDYEPEVRDVYLVAIPRRPDPFPNCDNFLLGNTDGYDDWGHVLVERHGYLNGEEYFFVAVNQY